MKIRFTTEVYSQDLYPLIYQGKTLASCWVAGELFYNWRVRMLKAAGFNEIYYMDRFEEFQSEYEMDELIIPMNVWIEPEELKRQSLLGVGRDYSKECPRWRYPWDVLALNEKIVQGLEVDDIQGEISPLATIRGHVVIGKGTQILPGVVIEGNVVIGENCQIGPNCYIRGNTMIGDCCRIGNAVEIKNSMIYAHTCVAHLSFVGDSIIGEKCNLGGGTITSNFRHDGQKHTSYVGVELVDTGRLKWGCVMGDGCHTGIHTSIYPGRWLAPKSCTLPGEIVKKNKTGQFLI